MTVSTLTVVPETSVSGTAPAAEPPAWYHHSADLTAQAIARAARPDFDAWLEHVKPAAACTRPVRLAGTSTTIEAATGLVLSTLDTATLPDGVLYKPCGNRRESACPSCSARYKRDAYHIIRTMLVGGEGVPDHVARHPAVFATFTAPSFGQVHTRYVKRHTCRRRDRCDCRPEPCHPRRDAAWCPHGRRIVCYARHAETDKQLGAPLCLDCYDHDGQVVWNLAAGELWRRTTIAVNRRLRQLARRRGVDPTRIRLTFGKAAEMQRRAVIHFHVIIRLDGIDPADPDTILPPPAGIDADDLADLIRDAAGAVAFTTDPHTACPDGWPIVWGDQVDIRTITVAAKGEITDGQVAAYLAKYATKSTEATGHVSARLTDASVDLHADPDGSHTERLIDACWTLSRPRWPLPGPVCLLACDHRSCWEIRQPPAWHPTRFGPVCVAGCPHRSCAEIREATRDPAAPWRRLRRWAHMFGFGGHFLTKSRRHRVTFTLKRQQRAVYRRTVTARPDPATGRPPDPDTTLVVNFLEFVGAGWHTTADAMLANTSAAMAREHAQAAREHLATLAA